MDQKYKRREPAFKAKVALEAVKGIKSIAQIASEFEIHPKQVTDWRDQLLQDMNSVFIPKTSMRKTKTNLEKEELLRKIGQLTVEVDYLKKKMRS